MGWRRQRGILQAGDPAPDFELRDLGGHPRPLREMLARGPALLAFFKVSCPVCQLIFPFLDRLHQAGGEAVRFVGISQDDARQTQGFNREYAVSFPTLLDAEAERYPVSNAFGISVVPSLLLVEQNGRISWTLESFSRTELEGLGRRVGGAPFRPGQKVPDWKGG